jgi:hypothetical protein
VIRLLGEVAPLPGRVRRLRGQGEAAAKRHHDRGRAAQPAWVHAYSMPSHGHGSQPISRSESVRERLQNPRASCPRPRARLRPRWCEGADQAIVWPPGGESWWPRTFSSADNSEAPFVFGSSRQRPCPAMAPGCRKPYGGGIHFAEMREEAGRGPSSADEVG